MKKSSLSLPTRLALTTTAVLVLVAAPAYILAARAMRVQLAGSVAESLSGMIDRMGRQVDQDVALLRELVSGEAAAVAGLSREAAAAALARQGPTLNFAFDFGVLLVDASGRVAADSRGRDIWAEVELADAEFFQRTFALGRPLLSQPFPAPTPDGEPIIMFTAPWRDADGKMIGVLAGGVGLAKNRILTLPTGVRVSRYGQIGIFTLDGQVVAHSERELLLREFENPLSELREEGAGSGAVEMTGPGGVRALLSVSRLEQADWIIAGVFLSDEVYAPLEKGLAAAHGWFAAGLLLCSLLVWLVSSRAVRDLHALAGEVADIGDAAAPGGRRVAGSPRGEAAELAGAINTMLGGLDKAARDNAELTGRLADAEERERRAIAADLHDSVCQTLALANLRLGGVRKRLAGDKEGAAVVQAQQLIEQSVGELKTLIFDLSPGILYELGLGPALEWQARRFGETSGMAIRCDGVEALPPGSVDDDVAIFLYRAAGELLANAAKHAAASIVEVAAWREGNRLHLRVSDDGRGVSALAEPKNGFGLRNLRARTAGLGGDFSLTARSGGGTVAEVAVPAVKPSAAN